MTSWTALDIPRLDGTSAVVTGANSGIGAATALYLARAGARTVLACRSVERGAYILERVRAVAPGADVRLVRLDLADLTSVREAAERIGGEVDGHLDLLVNNAGVMALPLRHTADGFEMQFGTNHLGHFALTGHLGGLLGAGPSRVVTVSSLGHRLGRIELGDLNSERGYDKWRAYGRSKLANLLFTAELDRRARAAARPLTAVAAHPGLSATELGQAGPRMAGHTWAARLERASRLYTQPASAGALPVLRAATDPSVTGGEYYGPGRLAETRGAPAPAARSSRARDMVTALALWEASVELTGVDPDPAAWAAQVS
ncbi:oxidoreductase [Streptomyces sp. NPDC051561]|uniref:oxidoreductase n=1 Tax=Streptomyces sp. NPDC051561 TaxID=3365658 RepID=UPI0037AEA7DE